MATTTERIAAPEPQPADTRLDPKVIRLVAILLVGGLAPLFDTTIVNVAISTLDHELHAPVATIQWVITGYLLSLSMMVPLSGWSMNRFGGKQMWMVSLALFMVGSVLSGLSWDITSLIIFRVIQGIGGGLMLPILQNLIVQAAGGRALGRLMSVVSLPALIGPILGPVLGGIIINSLNWRWIFGVNVPICIAALILAWFGMPATQPQRTQRLDIVGLLLLSPGLAVTLFGLAQVGNANGFGAPQVLIPLGIGVGLLLAFTIYASFSANPLVDLRLFRYPSLAAASGLLFLSGLTLYGALLLLPLYFQQADGQSVLAAGLLLAPQGMGALLTRSWVGSLTDRIGARPIVFAGIVITALGTIPFALVDAHTNYLILAGALLVRGAGLGAVTIPVMAAAYLGLQRDEVPHASIAIRVAQQIGGAFGAAVIAIILQQQIAMHNGLALAFGHTFWWSVGFTLLAIVPTLFLPRIASKRTGSAAK
ncbi:MAG: multidrug efflux MFS transporter [Ktedonobacterales bacterium]|nr:multidrug efflux MFS transporter [Ktedonobacterales bacterium]